VGTGEIKRQGSDADHSPPSSSEVKKGVVIPPLPRFFSRLSQPHTNKRDECVFLESRTKNA
jgi:hypothetical protein